MTDSSATAATLGSGSLVANYRIEREIGRGNMAVVYLATQLDLQRPVALKILTGGLARDQDFVSRFLNEARTAAALSHPNIVQAFSAGAVADDLYYFAMEYIEGETLHDRITREGPLKPADLLPIVLDIAGALDYGWTHQRLVHGDIKPENIMLSVKGESKLADFGLAKVSEHSFTGDGLMLTPLYAAPEMIRGQAAAQDCRPDIYSFGATLYHGLAGQPPFPGTDPQAVMQRHLNEAPPPLRQFNPRLPERLADFVTQRLLAKTAEERPQSWAEVISNLEAALARKRPVMILPSRSAGDEAAPRPAAVSRTPWVVGILAGLLAAGLGGWLAVHQLSDAAGRRDAAAAWRQVQSELAAETDPAAGLERLQHYGARHGRFAPPAFQAALQQQQQLLTAQLAAPPAVKPEAKPEVKPETKPGTGAAPPLRPAAPPEAKLAARPVPPVEAAVAVPAAAPAPAVNAVERADRFIVFLAAAVQAGATPGTAAWEPVIKLGRAWCDAYPGPSDEAAQAGFFLDTVLPAAEELLPKLILASPKLAGIPVTVKAHGTLPLDEVSLRGVSLRQKTDYGEVKLQVPWAETDRIAVLAALGKASLGAPGQALETARPLLAFLLLAGRADELDAQLQAFPESAEQRQWLILAASCRSAPQEAQCLQALADAVAAAQSHEFRTARRSLQRACAVPTAAATRHAAEIRQLQEVLAANAPEVRVSALVLQAQKEQAADPRQALCRLNLCLARYGALELPELLEVVPLRERTLDVLAARFRKDNGSLPSLYALPPLYPLAGWSSQFPGDSATILRQLKEHGDTASIKPLLTQLSAAALLDMGAWNEARLSLRNRAWVPGENQYPPFVAGILFGRALLYDRYRDAGTAPATALEALAKLRPRRGAGEDEANALLQGRLRLLSDLALFTRQWELPAAALPENVLARANSQTAQATALGLAAWRLEAGRPLPAAGELPPGSAADRAVEAARKILEDPTMADFPAAEGLPAEFRERYARLLLAALCQTPRQLPADRRHDPWDRLARIVPADGFVAADTRFGILLQQIALDLAANNLPAAETRLQEALKQAGRPADHAFYPRLLLLQAGLEFRRGFAGAARELLAVAMPAATTAGAAELAVAERHQGVAVPAVLDPDGKAAAVPAAFWDAWLLCSRLAAGGDSAAATEALNRLQAAARSLPERHFARLLGATPGTEKREAEAF
ncbi:MAG: serine/threonine-protein kinase [Lentisphaeria bacterium]